MKNLPNPDTIDWTDPASWREQARDAAWNRYANYPHADTSVGWSRYLAEIEAIDSVADILVEAR